MLSAVISSSAYSAERLGPKVADIIERTRTSTSTYTVYWRVRGTDGFAKPDYSWAAVFQAGPLRRVENKDGRVIVDCAAGTGVQFLPSIGHGEYSHGPKIAKRNCGIDTEHPILSAEWLGQRQTKFGLVDEVRIVRKEKTSTYEVTSAGELVGMTASYPGTKYVSVADPMLFERIVPGDLFSKKSLATSMVPKIVQTQGSRPAR